MSELGYEVVTNFSPADMPRGLFLAIMAIEQFNAGQYLYRLRAFPGNKRWMMIWGIN